MSAVIVTGNHFCIFDVDAATFAVCAKRIREVAPKPNFAKVPCASPMLAGLWHEGSEFLPIVRLPFQMDFRSGNPRQVLIVDGPHGNWGLLVDTVITISKLDYSPNNDPGETEWSSATLGMSTWEEKSVRVLHLDSVYKLLEQILKRDWQAQIPDSRELSTTQLGPNA